MTLRLVPRGKGEPDGVVVVRPGQPATFGRSGDADYSYPEDGFLSGVHFQVGDEDGQWRVKDLGSSNGLFLNDERVEKAAVRPGDEVRAGGTSFRIEMAAPDAPPLRVVSALREDAGGAWGVVDAARSPDMLQLLEENADKAVSLFDGTRLEEHRARAPHLVTFGDDEAPLLSFVYAGWGQSAAIYLKSDAARDDLVAHLRALLFPETEDGRNLLFRYYDPRVARAYLPTCTAAELSQFFGPVRTLFAEEDDLHWRIYRCGGDGLGERELDLSEPAAREEPA